MDKEKYMKKRSILQENIIVLDIYVPKNKASKYMEQILLQLKEEIGKSTLNTRDFMTSYAIIDQVISK